MKVINTYEVGHDSIDGGGFKIISQSPTYLYVQFESYKNGYVDDFEVAMLPGSPPTFDVRSSSRLGYLDYGVNAKRINYIAKRLNSEYNWSAPGVNLSKFQVRKSCFSNRTKILSNYLALLTLLALLILPIPAPSYT